MGAVLKAEIKRAFTGIRFPAAAAIIFLILELNSLRFREAEDILYLFIHTWGRSVTPLLAMARVCAPNPAPPPLPAKRSSK